MSEAKKAFSSEVEVLNELKRLCTSPGFVHTLAYLTVRDCFIMYEHELTPDVLQAKRGPQTLLRSELNILIGLAVQSTIDLTKPSIEEIERMASLADALLAELHNIITGQFHPIYDSVDKNIKFPGETNPGPMYKEAFIYGSEYPYLFQYKDFALRRYSRDIDWLQKHVGFKPDDMLLALNSIEQIQLERANIIFRNANAEDFENIDLLQIFNIDVRTISEKSGLSDAIVKSVISAFCLTNIPTNEAFFDVGSYNMATSHPFIPTSESEYIIFMTINLAISAYESPTYWMFADNDYKDRAAEHRGIYTEEHAATFLRRVFGPGNVYTNVVLRKGRRRLGEIDLLAVYADRAIVVQAKSKRLTQLSRKGDYEAIQRDFEHAVQQAYEQGCECAKYLEDEKCTLETISGKPLDLRRQFNEIFVTCLTSEFYPALAFQARNHLKMSSDKSVAPYITDLFVLDVLSELVGTPAQFLYYLHRRTLYWEKLSTNNELSALGFHLKTNLWINDDYDILDIGDDFTTDVDIAMYARREGQPGKADPPGVLTRFHDTIVDKIIHQIDDDPGDHRIEIAYLLLGMNSAAGRQFVDACNMLIDRAKEGRTGDFVMGFDDDGITVHSSPIVDQEACERLHDHAELSKYRVKASKWFGILITPDPNHPVAYAIGLKGTWQKKPEVDDFLQKHLSAPSKSLRQALLTNQRRRRKKIGRNDQCPCGSGKKYKRCCLGKPAE